MDEKEDPRARRRGWGVENPGPCVWVFVSLCRQLKQLGANQKDKAERIKEETPLPEKNDNSLVVVLIYTFFLLGTLTKMPTRVREKGGSKRRQVKTKVKKISLFFFSFISEKESSSFSLFS